MVSAAQVIYLKHMYHSLYDINEWKRTVALEVDLLVHYENSPEHSLTLFTVN